MDQKLALTLHDFKAEVRSALAAARSGSLVQDNLLEAIPKRMRSCVLAHARAGSPDPVLAAAKDAWFKSVIAADLRFAGAGNGWPREAESREDADRLARAMGEVTKATINENTATQGGNLVPSLIEADILAHLSDSGLVRRLTTPRVMTSKTDSVPAPDAVTSYVVNELGAAVTAGEPQINSLTLTARTFVAYGLSTFEAMQDGAIGIAEVFTRLSAEEIGRQEDRLALEGTSGDPWLGLVGTSGINTMDATTATNASAIPSWTTLAGVVFKSGKRTSRRKGAFFFHPIALQNIVGQVGTNLPPIPQSALVPDPEADAYLSGYRAFGCDQITSNRTDVGGTDVSYGYFGNFDYLQLGDRLGVTFMASQYVKTAEALIALRAVKRTGMAAKGAAFTMLKKVKTS